MKRTLPVILALSVLTAGSAFAIDLGLKTTDTQKVDKDLSLMWKKSMGSTEAEGKRKQKTWSKGRDKTSSNSDRESVSANRGATASISVNLADLLATKITALEQSGVEPFASCQLYSAPKLPADFGLSAERRPGVLDTNRANYLQKASTSNMAVASVGDEQKIREYGICEARYGAYLAQSLLNFGGDIKAMKATIKREKDDTLTVDGIAYDDAVKMANLALDDAIKTGPQGDIKAKMEASINDKGNCRFAGRLESFSCGGNKIGIGTQPTLMRANVQLYGVTITGSSTIYGMTAQFSMQTGWSYQTAFENMKQVGKFVRFSEDVSKYAEEAENRGRTKESAYAKKKAVDMAVGSDASLSAQALGSAGQSIGAK